MSSSEMPCRSLGKSGIQISTLSLGGWLTFGEHVRQEDTIAVILKSAFEAGVNFFDFADVYGRGACEEAVRPALCSLPRHEIVVSSKVFFPMSDDVNDRGLSRKHIMESVDKSLRRLGMDYLDIYFCHRFDERTPVEETARAMDDLVHRGKILYWGTSQWTGVQLREVHELCRRMNLYSPQVEQPQYNLLARYAFETDVQPAATGLGMGLVTWSPLSMGILSGKYDQGMPPDSRMAKEHWLHKGHLTEDNLSKVRRFKKIADAVGCTRSQLAIARLMSQPGISSVILGATRLEQLRENLGAMQVKMTPQVHQQIDDLFPCQPPPNDNVT